MAGLTDRNTLGTTSWNQIAFAIRCENGQVKVYEYGTHRTGLGVLDGVYGTDTVFQIRISSEDGVQYLQDGELLYTSTMTITWPLHVVTAIIEPEMPAIADVKYLMGSDIPPSTPPPPPSPSPPPLQPGDYVMWDGGAHEELSTNAGMVGKKEDACVHCLYNAWSAYNIISTDSAQKGISFR